MRLIIQPWAPDMSGGRMAEEFFLHRVLVEPGQGEPLGLGERRLDGGDSLDMDMVATGDLLGSGSGPGRRGPAMAPATMLKPRVNPA
jgi:hypothetical protein